MKDILGTYVRILLRVELNLKTILENSMFL